MADINGDSSDNTLTGTSGSDTIRGQSGNDSIDGGAGNDTLFGGNGDDSITGGAGDDVIVGGRGNDTMAAGASSPSDTFVIRDGDGTDTIVDFDPAEPDIIDFRMAEITSYQDVLDRISEVGDDTIITFDNGDSVRLVNVESEDLSSTNFTYSTGPVCLHAGTLVRTSTGYQAVETLKVGDLVETLDHGARPIRHIVSRRVHFSPGSPAGKPVLIVAGALGWRAPFADTILSPQHRIMMAADGHAGAIIAANKLRNRTGIRQMRGRVSAHYINLLFDRHEILWANGMMVESLLLTDQACKAAPSLAAFANGMGLAAMQPARPILDQAPMRRNLQSAA